jgi:hypothetical protein
MSPVGPIATNSTSGPDVSFRGKADVQLRRTCNCGGCNGPTRQRLTKSANVRPSYGVVRVNPALVEIEASQSRDLVQMTFRVRAICVKGFVDAALTGELNRAGAIIGS